VPRVARRQAGTNRLRPDLSDLVAWQGLSSSTVSSGRCPAAYMVRRVTHPAWAVRQNTPVPTGSVA